MAWNKQLPNPRQNGSWSHTASRSPQGQAGGADTGGNNTDTFTQMGPVSRWSLPAFLCAVHRVMPAPVPSPVHPSSSASAFPPCRPGPPGSSTRSSVTGTLPARPPWADSGLQGQQVTASPSPGLRKHLLGGRGNATEWPTGRPSGASSLHGREQ